MKALFTDLDNTLIYSYKQNIGKDKVLVETKDGKELSFMTKTAYQYLLQLCKKLAVIPVTTRSLHQYNRISFHKTWSAEQALVANGGILLLNNKIDEKWYQESLKLIQPAEKQLNLGIHLLQIDDAVSFDIRKVDELFVFTKSNFPEKTLSRLRSHLDLQVVSVYQNGVKIYIMPKCLNKGNAILRFKKLYNFDKYYAAGDSEFDIPMLDQADYALFPEGLPEYAVSNNNRYIVPKNCLFSDEILYYIARQT